MEWEQPSWEGADEGWTLEKVDTATIAKKAAKNRKRKQVPASIKRNEPETKKQKLGNSEQSSDQLEIDTSTTQMTKSMKRRLRRKNNELKRLQGANTDQETPKGSKKEDKQEKKQDQPEEILKQQKSNPKANSTLSALKEKLKSGQFRWLNEQLYTTNSDDAMKLFSEEPELFQAYHEGFRHQVQDWPVNPVDIYIKFLKKNPTLVVGDFGCGDAKLAASVSNKVHSFDLQAVNERVTACDIANVPLKNSTLDVVIFSLSLMGTNYIDFLKEAYRVLKLKGQLKIAEVKSRFSGIESFIATLRTMGFDFVSINEDNTMFVLFEFTKSKRRVKPNKIKNYELKACIYKRR